MGVIAVLLLGTAGLLGVETPISGTAWTLLAQDSAWLGARRRTCWITRGHRHCLRDALSSRMVLARHAVGGIRCMAWGST